MVEILKKKAALRKTMERTYKPDTQLLDVFQKALAKHNLDLRITTTIQEGTELIGFILTDIESGQEVEDRVKGAYNTRTIEKYLLTGFMLPDYRTGSTTAQAEYLLKECSTEELQAIVEKYQIKDLKELDFYTADALIRRLKNKNNANGRITR